MTLLREDLLLCSSPLPTWTEEQQETWEREDGAEEEEEEKNGDDEGFLWPGEVYRRLSQIRRQMVTKVGVSLVALAAVALAGSTLRQGALQFNNRYASKYSQQFLQNLQPQQLWETLSTNSENSRNKDAEGRCATYGCGGFTGYNRCQCISSCLSDGNCCDDYKTHCLARDSKEVLADKIIDTSHDGTCAANGCMERPLRGATCQCVADCRDFGDCCPDFESTCGNEGSSDTQPQQTLVPAPLPKHVKGDPTPPNPTAGMTHEEIISEQKMRDKMQKQEAEKAKANIRTFKKMQGEWEKVLKWQAVRSCPVQFVHKDAVNGNALKQVSNMKTAAECQKACTKNDKCDAWVWGLKRNTPGLTDVCFLKELGQDTLGMVTKDGVISGMPCCRPAGGASKNGHEGIDCPQLIFDSDLKTQRDLSSLKGVHSSYACQKACTAHPSCGAFTWGAKRGVAGLSDVCFLKVLGSTEAPNMTAKEGVISGLPCGCRATPENAIWPDSDVQKFTMPLPKPNRFRKPGSMLCIALIMPYSYEQGLLTMQYENGAGIFNCDEYAVYSNQALVLAPGLVTRRVLTTQKCTTGGEFKTALNLNIFTAVWRQVISDGQYLLFNWIVKADPDTVFFPHRLRAIVAKHEKGAVGGYGQGAYFNNCKYGMHGPLEVFSQNAVNALASMFLGCFHYFQKLCSGDCSWGEDMWVDQCLKKFVNSTRINEYNVLEEDHCDPAMGWQSCEDTTKAAFHPFKIASRYLVCHKSALAAEQKRR